MAYGPAQSVYTTQAPPATTATWSAYYVGADIVCAVAGRISALRYYRHASAPASRTMRLWDNAGVSLGTATTSGETGTGWQTVALSTPVAITAGQKVRVSQDLTGFVAYRNPADGSPPTVNGDLTLTAHVEGATVRPADVVSASYYVDIVFEAGTADTNDLWVWNGTTAVPSNVTVCNGTSELASSVAVT